MIIDDKVIMSLPPPPPYLASPNTGTQFHTTSSPTLTNPPPPFSEALQSPSSQHGSQPDKPLKLSSLPSHILLQIVYNTFPTHPALDTALVERQRKTLLWLAKSLRLVNKALYIACMHVLRSTYLPAYTSLLRPYYSSDPFPSTPVPQAHSSSLNTIQRETPVLDLFIALKVREDVFVDDSELHLEREDMFKDIFDHAQPKARLEDLVRIYGVKQGVVTLSPPGRIAYSSSGPGSSSSTTYSSGSSNNNTVVPSSNSGSRSRSQLPLPSPTPPPVKSPRSSASRFFSAFRKSKTPSESSASNTTVQPKPRPQEASIRPVSFSLLSVSFSTRKVGLQLMSSTGAKRTIVEVPRMSKDERLEATAARIIAELKGLLAG